LFAPDFCRTICQRVLQDIRFLLHTAAIWVSDRKAATAPLGKQQVSCRATALDIGSPDAQLAEVIRKFRYRVRVKRYTVQVPEFQPAAMQPKQLRTMKLADFGLAKRVMLDSTPIGESPTISAPITERGTIVGTVAYMSPEQAQDKDIDARSDIFSFGIVLYEMATGRRAFPGESPATIIGEILHKEPKPIRQLNPQVPEELQRIVAKTLEKDREDRYQTAHELMVDLRRLTKKETERSQIGLAAEPPKQEKSRKWTWMGAAAAVCVAAWVALTGRGTPADSAPLPMEQLTFSSETKSPSIFTDGSRIYFVSGNNPVEMSVKGGNTASLRAAIGTMSILDISPDGAGFLLLQSDLNDETQRGTLWTMPVLGGVASGWEISRGAAQVIPRMRS
jgi:serine/threonine protein kinase